MNPIKGDLNFEHLLNIHKYIFNDIYEWAGKTRFVNISKGSQFCNYAFIESMADEIFLKLHNDNYLIGLTNEQTINKLSYYLGELNAIHPFREGNGRTQRIFIEYLANIEGYYVDFSKVSSKEMIEASSDSFLCDYRKMENIFRNIIDKIPIDEQEMFIRSIAYKGSVFMKTFEYWKKIKYQSSSEERSSTKRKLTSWEVSFIFSVDLYNEGIESNCELGSALLHPVHEKPSETTNKF